MEELETSFLDGAHVICTTLNSAAAASMERTVGAAVAIIDEAAQAVEPATLIPLQLGSCCTAAVELPGGGGGGGGGASEQPQGGSEPPRRIRHVVLVGDPQQLAATTFGRQAGHQAAYSRSLFERLQRAGHPTHLLDTQYRMHPAISQHPAALFYDGRLRDAPQLLPGSGDRRARRFHGRGWAPFLFFDLAAGGQEVVGKSSKPGRRLRSRSRKNPGAMRLYRRSDDILRWADCCLTRAPPVAPQP